MTAVELVRGALAAAHAFVKPGTSEKDLWKAYRAAYNAEPFVRIVKDKTRHSPCARPQDFERLQLRGRRV